MRVHMCVYACMYRVRFRYRLEVMEYGVLQRGGGLGSRRFTQAVSNHCVKSTAIREGLLHKASMWLIIIAVMALEMLAQHVAGLSIEGLGTVPVCVIVILMELVSIWENVCKANPQLRESPLGVLLESKLGDDAK